MKMLAKLCLPMASLMLAACEDTSVPTGVDVAGPLPSISLGTDRWVDAGATATAPGSGCGAKAGYKTIRAAVTAASSGDHVIICPGVYEGVSYGGSTKNNLTLRSTNPVDPRVVRSTIIEQLGTTGYAIRLGWVDGQVSGTIIDGLTIRNAHDTGINIQNSPNNTVRNSLVLNSRRGISLTGTSPSGNRIENTFVLGSAQTGVGLGSGPNNTMSGSTVCGSTTDINISTSTTKIENSRWDTKTGGSYTDGGGNLPSVNGGALLLGLVSFNSIQAAVTAAISGDDVIVCPGVYEGVSYGGKHDLTLRSTNPLNPSVVEKTIIEARGTTGYAIRLGWVNGQVKGAIIDGLTIRNASHTGINIQNSPNNTVRNSRVLNSARGISLTGTSPSGNRIENTFVLGSAQTGVSVGSGVSNTISGSTICGNAPDINIGASSTVIANSRWDTQATFTKFTNGGGNMLCDGTPR